MLTVKEKDTFLVRNSFQLSSMQEQGNICYQWSSTTRRTASSWPARGPAVSLGKPHNGMDIYGMGKMVYIHSELLAVV